MENKWEFLEKGQDMRVPVSPILDLPGICVKHKNEEGGLGIHFYRNAMEGGDWIIQKVISNSDFVQSLLPSNAPLSTFRILTQSRAAANQCAHCVQRSDPSCSVQSCAAITCGVVWCRAVR